MSNLLNQEPPGAIKPHAPLLPIFFLKLKARTISLFRYNYPICTLDQEVSKQSEVVIGLVIRRHYGRRKQVVVVT